MRIAALILLLTLSLSNAADGASGNIFSGKLLKFTFDRKQYSSIMERPAAEGADAGTKELLYELNLQRQHPIGGIDADSGTVCRGTIASCQEIGQGIVPYWEDGLDGSLRIGDPTETVRESVIGGKKAFEVFPLCGWSGKEENSPMGGQCYTAVLSFSDKVISFTFILGKNSGCKDYERCWRKELNSARRILASVL